MDELGYEIKEIPLSKNIQINYSLPGRPSRFYSLHDLVRLPKADLEQKLDKLKQKRLGYYIVNQPPIISVSQSKDGEEIKTVNDSGRERLVISKQINDKTLTLELRNRGVGTPNEVGEIQAIIGTREDVATINLMLKDLFAVFDKQKTNSGPSNSLKDELGVDFQFKFSDKP